MGGWVSNSPFWFPVPPVDVVDAYMNLGHVLLPKGVSAEGRALPSALLSGRIFLFELVDS